MNNRQSNEGRDTSVRITLRISQECSANIIWLANYFNITQKEVFDKIAGILFTTKEEYKGIADLIALAAKERGEKGGERVRKAQVISSKTHNVLNNFSKKHGVSRDAFVETLVSINKTFADEVVQKVKPMHAEALDIVNNFWRYAKGVEKQLINLLGSEDPVVNRFGPIIVYIMNLSFSIENEIKTGIPVDPDEF